MEAKRTFPKKGTVTALSRKAVQGSKRPLRDVDASERTQKKSKKTVSRGLESVVKLNSGGGLSRKNKTADGMKETKNRKVKSGKKTKKSSAMKGEPVKGTCLEYDQLVGFDEEGDDDDIDVEDMMGMLSDEGEDDFEKMMEEEEEEEKKVEVKQEEAAEIPTANSRGGKKVKKGKKAKESATDEPMDADGNEMNGSEEAARPAAKKTKKKVKSQKTKAVVSAEIGTKPEGDDDEQKGEEGVVRKGRMDPRAARRAAMLMADGPESDDEYQSSDEEKGDDVEAADLDPRAARRRAMLMSDEPEEDSEAEESSDEEEVGEAGRADESDDSESSFDEAPSSHSRGMSLKKRLMARGTGMGSDGESDKDEGRATKNRREEADGDESGEDGDAAVAKQFRENMANMPLSKVREMKEKLGIKLFNKAYFGTTEAEATKEKEREIEKERKRADNQKRFKNRPQEVSSKIRVSKFRNIYPGERLEKKRWDPRFDDRSGELKERCYDDNYGFIEDIRKEEKQELRREQAECVQSGDTERAEKIARAIRLMDDQERTVKELRLKQSAMEEIRQENIERMMRGKAPKFKTKAQVRTKFMEKKFEQLKSEHRLDKYVQRKAKKDSQKQIKAKPFEREYGYQ